MLMETKGERASKAGAQLVTKNLYQSDIIIINVYD
jgi:hypothetical protein